MWKSAGGTRPTRPSAAKAPNLSANAARSSSAGARAARANRLQFASQPRAPRGGMWKAIWRAGVAAVPKTTVSASS